MAEAASTPDMRTRLVEVALALLQQDGPAALTVRNITTAAGCSTTGVYTYFGGKHGLVEAIFIDGFESFDRALADGYTTGALRDAGRAYRRWALAHPTQYMVMFGRAVPDYEPSPVAHERSLASFGLLVSALRAASLDDGFDIDALAYHYWATLHGYVMLELAAMHEVAGVDADSLFERALDALER